MKETLRALARPRRAIPLLLLAAAMLVTEWLAARALAPVAVDALLIAAFCLIGPASWRALCGEHGMRGGLVLYAVMSAGVVGVFGSMLPVALSLPGTYLADPPALGLLLVLFLVGGWGLGRDIELEAGYTSERDRAARLALEAERAQIMALRAHLDPHFLFNTLNAIAEWCRDDPEVAEAATLHLASILRSILDGIRNPTWSLASELSMLRRLFQLYEIRDRHRYRLQLEVPDPVPEASVPPMLFLPLFENAITHGPSAGHDGEVYLRVRAKEREIDLQIENPGAYRGRRKGGEGIAIVERRIALAYGDRARLSLRAEGSSTITELSIPLRPLIEEVATR